MTEQRLFPGLKDLAEQAKREGSVKINASNVGQALADKLLGQGEKPMLTTFRNLPEFSQEEILDRSLEITIYDSGMVAESRKPTASVNILPINVIR
jgi:hypothetical protein